MSINYSAQYTDEFGTESTTIFDDGKVMRISLRGVEFSGGLYSFRVSSKTNDITRNLFNFFEDEILGYPIICGYSIDYQIPVRITSKDEELQALLRAHIECGKPVDASNRKIFSHRSGTEKRVLRWIDDDQKNLSLEIKYQGKSYKSGGKSGFETQLNDISSQFPEDVYLKICLNCRLSEYPPVFAGPIRCFRNAKSELEHVKGKWDFLKLWDEKGIDIDETYLCPEFEKRQPYSR